MMMTRMMIKKISHQLISQVGGFHTYPFILFSRDNKMTINFATILRPRVSEMPYLQGLEGIVVYSNSIVSATSSSASSIGAPGRLSSSILKKSSPSVPSSSSDS